MPKEERHAMIGRSTAVAAGAAWLIASFLPWTARGVLSSSTLIEAANFARRGVLDVVPPAAAALLLAPAVSAVVLIGLAGLDGSRVATGRTVVGWLGCAVTALLVGRLTGFEIGRCGSGALLAMAGMVTFVIGEGVGISAKRPRGGGKAT